MKHEKMNADLKVEWLHQLRSGRYKQGTTMLKGCETNSFCCLGVLGDIMVGMKGTIDWHMGTLPLSIADTAGLTLDTQFHLADMNDGGDDFKTIAKWIEENL